MTLPRASVARVAGLGAIAILVVVAAVIVLGGSDRHDVYITVDKATGVLKGQHVRAAGSVVGTVASIKPVDRGHRARLKLSLDDKVWPLPKGSTFTVRWSGTVSLFNRYVALRRGPDGGPAMVADGGSLPASVLKVPVDYGELLNVFTQRTRGDLKQFLDRSGLVLDQAGKPLNRALRVAPGAVTEADNVLSTLDRSREQVHQLVRSTDSVVNAVQRADPGLGELVVSAGTTMDALASQATSLRSTLDSAPSTFRKATSTLARADGTLSAAQTAVRRLGPGVQELRRVAAPLNRVLGSLVDVGPDARATLATAATSAPDLTKLVSRLGTLSPELRSIGVQGDKALNCIRPYSPEIVSLGTLWASSLAGLDGAGKYIRAVATVALPFPHNLSAQNSGDIAKAYPGLEYGFPRPPGSQAGQPWFLPECGAGKDAIDPSKDPEARSDFPPLAQIPVAPSTKQKRSR